MIRKQEGGTESGRLLLPGERRDWAARNLIPLPPSRLFMAPLSRRRAPSLGVRGERLPGDRRGAAGAGHYLIWKADLNTDPAPGPRLVRDERCVIVFLKHTTNKGFRVLG